ncbi:polysaccharide export protein [Caballeronia catudaia]|uniref:Polysaccharide export protein n=1 Tax=Caballeronia catudaia TaxID=1777136 RepID=A0A158CAG4_9BURK|nr:polysaccharide biosynthesis/export family protein [Caballeronia catudaia]SAK79289.1 polysaccharide export protein [Caballeronia catudaia]
MNYQDAPTEAATSNKGFWQGMQRIAGIVLCVTLGACAAAPGMKMTDSPTLPVSAGSTSNSVNSENIPIRDIDLSLIRKMQNEAATSGGLDDPSLLIPPGPYRIGPGDVLQITVWDHPEIAAAAGAPLQGTARTADPAPGFVVDQSGNLQFPYVGNIHVAGLQPDEARQSLVAQLGKTLRSPQVTLRVASFRSQAVYIDGEVRTPGVQPVNDIQMSIYDAISRAGGFSSTADQSRVVLIRNGTSHSISFTAMLGRGQSPAQIVLRNKDVVRVLARTDSPVYVMGEVNKPASAVPMSNGKLTLSDALSQAGSLNSTSADAAQIYVIRNASAAEPQVFHLNAHSPVAMILANQFDLQPSDVVYVDGNGLVRFSRVLSLLLPAINAGLTAAILTK